MAMRPGCKGVGVWVLVVGILFLTNRLFADEKSSPNTTDQKCQQQNCSSKIAETDTTVENPIQRVSWAIAGTSSGDESDSSEKQVHSLRCPATAANEAKRTEMPSWLAELDRLQKRTSTPENQKNGVPAQRSTADVSQVIRNHSQDISTIYHRVLKLNPALNGTVSMRILVDPVGSVQDVEIVQSTVSDSVFLKQLCLAVKQWQDFGAIEQPIIQVYRQDFVFGE
ncbi:MAG TPA: AgmX/PglI C-terminal domain-containing protein [bacterium]|nr:AgmX/PglI C-terminal domain-containing protein [bacterium]